VVSGMEKTDRQSKIGEPLTSADTNALLDRAERKRGEDSARFARRRRNTVCRSPHPGREDFHREQECRAIRPDVEDELRDREDRHQATGRCDVGHPGPDGIQHGRQCAEDELLADSADEIREEDSHVEGG